MQLSCLPCLLVENFISHSRCVRLADVYVYVVSTVAIGMLEKFPQGVINWNRVLCGYSSIAQVVVASLVQGKELIPYE